MPPVVVDRVVSVLGGALTRQRLVLGENVKILRPISPGHKTERLTKTTSFNEHHHDKRSAPGNRIPPEGKPSNRPCVLRALCMCVNAQRKKGGTQGSGSRQGAGLRLDNRGGNIPRRRSSSLPCLSPTKVHPYPLNEP